MPGLEKGLECRIGSGKGGSQCQSENSVPGIAEAESSESDGETEPAKSFHRRISTNKEIKCSVCTKEGYLMKQTSSFQRWRRRYFKLKGRKLYYGKDTKSVIYDEIDLRDLSIAECHIKNVHLHSFQLITPFRVLVLTADSRKDMEEWIGALKSAATNQYYEGMDQVHSLLSGRHNWYATSHARPTYCNICREALSGVTSHGLSCEVCKMKSHKRCSAKALNNCKWTTLSSVGKEIIEDDDGLLSMPHQWTEGNLPVSAKCAVCEKPCGSVRKLQDWRCLWWRGTVHTAWRPLHPTRCPLGPCRVSVVPPTALTTIGTDESWDATRPQGCSPLLVFVNSKSGDNQGVRFLRRFKQLLNPAQVFDLMNGGPVLGLRLFKCFNPFRILICSGDGSVGWVLSEIDKLHMSNQCQIGVLPLGTGNDLARVLGWGSACDDDAHLPNLLEKYERATTKMLDRWSIMTFVSHVPLESEEPKTPSSSLLDPGGGDSSSSSILRSQVSHYESSVAAHLSTLLHSEDHSVVINSAKVLCETVKSLIVKVGSSCAVGDLASDNDSSISAKCVALNEKLERLLRTLNRESNVSVVAPAAAVGETGRRSSSAPPIAREEDSVIEEKYFVERDALVARANSLKKAVRQIIEHTERTLDQQTVSISRLPLPEIRLEGPEEEVVSSIPSPGVLEGPSFPSVVSYVSPFLSSMTTNFPLPPASPVPQIRSTLLPPPLPLVIPPPPSLFISSHMAPPPAVVVSPSASYLQLPSQTSPGSLSSPHTAAVSPDAISPLPDIRRESQCEFSFPPTPLPAPHAFADLEAKQHREAIAVAVASLEAKQHREAVAMADTEHRIRKASSAEDVEVRIQSSNDNLVDVGEDEPYTFEEKSISEIRDSLATSLDTSLDDTDDLEEDDDEGGIDDEEVDVVLDSRERGVRGTPDGGGAEEEEAEANGGKDSGDSEDTDDTVREKRSEIVSTPADVASDVDAARSPLAVKVHLNDEVAPPSEAGEDREFECESLEVSDWEAQEEGLEVAATATATAAAAATAESGDAEGNLLSLPAERIVEGAESTSEDEKDIAAGPTSGGLISKVLLANADALCAAASPLMDLDDSSLEGYDERCIMNNYFGIGIDAKITLDFHNKRVEHPEKCRSRTKNFMWYGVLASKEWLCKTYKNFEQRVQLECDGERLPLPSLQGIVVLNIPSFMGGTNFWGGKKEDDCFLAPSFDDRVLEVVAVFGSAQMAASRIINLQHHRIAQCSSIKITVLGEEGVPVQVDGEAWTQPPGIIRIVHKNRVQMLCRNRELEVSLKAWEEKQSSLGRHNKQPTLLTDEEIHCLETLAHVVAELLKNVRLCASTSPRLETPLREMASNGHSRLDKIWRDNRIIEGPNLRMLATELVTCARTIHTDVSAFLKEGALVMTASQEDNLRTSLTSTDSELKKAHEKDHLIHFEEEAVPPPHERKRSLSKGALFKLKFKREALRSRGGGFEGQVREWGLEEVAAWLGKLDLSEHKEAFVANDIRGAELLSLERRDLKELGVLKIGHIKRIQQAVKDIKDNKSAHT